MHEPDLDAPRDAEADASRAALSGAHSSWDSPVGDEELAADRARAARAQAKYFRDELIRHRATLVAELRRLDAELAGDVTRAAPSRMGARRDDAQSPALRRKRRDKREELADIDRQLTALDARFPGLDQH